MTAQKRKHEDPVEDAVATWLFQRYEERLRKGRPAQEWHSDARGLLAEIRRATKAAQAKTTTETESREAPWARITLGELLKLHEVNADEEDALSLDAWVMADLGEEPDDGDATGSGGK